MINVIGEQFSQRQEKCLSGVNITINIVITNVRLTKVKLVKISICFVVALRVSEKSRPGLVNVIVNVL